MSTLEQQILKHVSKLDLESQRRVLDFVIQLETKPLSARDLMKLPHQERQQHVMAAIGAATDEDFEIFEAYRDEAPSHDG